MRQSARDYFRKEPILFFNSNIKLKTFSIKSKHFFRVFTSNASCKCFTRNKFLCTYMCVLRKASTARFLKIVFTFFQSLNIPTKEKYFKKKLITQDEMELNF